ncbi:MAG TPA: 3-isopropylmalate dehydrogenase [Steroidobacteraceae bacterium]|nr:3-isopropylmalate dehydrogenase [Steroidobacteraceae bacterium]
MKAHIAVLPGDGIGPEVIAEAVRCLKLVATNFRHEFRMEEAPVGAVAMDATGMPLPPATLALAKTADAVLFGAIGAPRYSDPALRVRPEQAILQLRRELGLYANLRPVVCFEAVLDASPLKPELLAGVDIMVIRELTGGIYFGTKTRTETEASDLCVYTVPEVERIARLGARIARHRKRRLTSVDKANVLETSRLWRAVVTRVLAAEFPDVAVEHMYVDAAAMHLLRRPADFDVLITENMFGDILTDEASMLAGSLGLCASASIGNETRGIYEPIHGSAPDIAGRGIANPYATILSAALLLRYSLGLEREARALEAAVVGALGAGVRTADLSPVGAPASTRAAGDAVLARL